MNSPILTPMKYATASLIALLALGGSLTQARADAIPAACMTSDATSRTMGTASLSMSGYSAALATGDAHLGVGQVVVQDRQGHLTLPNLRDANALISFGLLKLVHDGSPTGCHDVNGRAALRNLRDALHQGAVAELVWTGVALSSGKNRYSAEHVNATLRAGQASGSIDIVFAASGLSAPGGSALPASLRTTLTIPEQMLDGGKTPEGKITISSLEALWAKGKLEGNGWISPGHTTATSTGQIHLAITDLSDLLATIRPVLPGGVSTALSVAQFMGHRDGNKVMWDLTLGGGILKVNSIPIPVN